jgi:Serine dehydrogenase proteinase
VPVQKRVALIRALEKERGSRLVSYLTGDRSGPPQVPGLQTSIGMDVFPFFYDVLSRVGRQKQIDLLIYSTGGATMAAWGLVNLLREFADRLCVLVPFKAHSSATLIALGADEIVMSRMGQLSPVDPTINSPFNPVLPGQIPGTTPQFLPVSVEDVIGFIDLLREEGKLKEETSLTELLKALASDIRPLALGSVYRAKKLIGMLARNLLAIHMGPEDEAKIEKIVETLTRKLYSHDYLIGRREAKEIDLKVADCPEDLEERIMQLLDDYSKEMELNTPYNQDETLGNQNTRVTQFDRAFIETADRTYVFRTKREIKRLKTVQQGIQVEGFQEKTLQEGWQMEHRKN